MPHLEDGQIHALLDGELDSAEVREIEQHLATCEECVRRVEEARGLLGESDQLITMLDPPNQDTRSGTGRSPLVRRLSVYTRLAWAASIVLAAGLGYYGAIQRRTQATTSALEDQTPVASVPGTPPLDRESTSTPAAASEDRPRRELQAKPPKSGLKESKPAQPAEPALTRRDQSANVVTDSVGRANETTMDAKKAMAPPPATRAGAVTGAVSPAAPQATGQAMGLRSKLNKDEEFQPTTMEEAVHRLSGTIRLIDGLQLSRILTNAAPVAAEGDATAGTMVRVVYPDEPGREIWLDQQRLASTNRLGMLPGDTLSSQTADGIATVRWLDPAGFLLTLTGHVGVDSLKVLARNVR
jgi:anti-sigma factor RsiW